MRRDRRTVMALVLARDSQRSSRLLARHLVEAVDGMGTMPWTEAYARRIELFESMMRCLVGYGVRPGELQDMLNLKPCEQDRRDMDAVLEAESRLERHLDLFVRNSRGDVPLQDYLVGVLADVRRFREVLTAVAGAAITDPMPAASKEVGRTVWM